MLQFHPSVYCTLYNVMSCTILRRQQRHIDPCMSHQKPKLKTEQKKKRNRLRSAAYNRVGYHGPLENAYPTTESALAGTDGRQCPAALCNNSKHSFKIFKKPVPFKLSSTNSEANPAARARGFYYRNHATSRPITTTNTHHYDNRRSISPTCRRRRPPRMRLAVIGRARSVTTSRAAPGERPCWLRIPTCRAP